MSYRWPSLLLLMFNLSIFASENPEVKIYRMPIPARMKYEFIPPIFYSFLATSAIIIMIDRWKEPLIKLIKKWSSIDSDDAYSLGLCAALCALFGFVDVYSIKEIVTNLHLQYFWRLHIEEPLITLNEEGIIVEQIEYGKRIEALIPWHAIISHEFVNRNVTQQKYDRLLFVDQFLVLKLERKYVMINLNTLIINDETKKEMGHLYSLLTKKDIRQAILLHNLQTAHHFNAEQSNDMSSSEYFSWPQFSTKHPMPTGALVETYSWSNHCENNQQQFRI